MRAIDLNCDMGESFGPWRMGTDEEIMPYITSANIACGAHAGDPVVMRRTVQLARRHGVAIGAHPGYPDLQGFGRRSMKLSPEEIIALMLSQLGALWGIVRAEGSELRHVKPHGALYNTASTDRELSNAIAEAIRLFSTTLILYCLPSSALEAAGIEQGLRIAREGFADRAYEPSGLLVDRRQPGAIRSSPEDAARQALDLAQGRVIARDGTHVTLQVDTLCIHGDTPGASEIARHVRTSLEEAGFTVSAPYAHAG